MKPVRSVERAISILFLVAQSNAPLGLSEISRAIGLDKATSLRLLSTLANAKLVQQDPITRRYMPGANISRLYNAWRSDLRNISRPHLEALLKETEETICLACPRGLERVYVDALPPPHELCIVPAIGSAAPIYAGASGRVFMAFMPPGDCDRIIKQTGLKAVTPNTVTDEAVYMAQLDKVRERGYAHTTGEALLHSSAISAPVFDADGNLTAAVVVRAPESRMGKERAAKLAPLVVRTARNISEELGHGLLQAAVNV